MTPTTPLSTPTLEPPTAGRARELDVLLIQVRDDERALHHEQLCFLERLQIAPDRLRTVNVVAEPVPDAAVARDAGMVILGGAGRHSAHHDYPFTAPLVTLIRELVEAGTPFFGSCFGHQFLARALGGTVETDLENEEIGTFDVDLNDEGVADPLFAGFPRRFPVHLGHHDQVTVLPPGVSTLAGSARCRHQVIRVPGRPVYGTQFHGEMSEDHMRERLQMYRDEYMPGDDALARLEESLRPTDLVDTLLGRFADLYGR